MIIESIPIPKINPARYNPRKDLQPADSEYQKLKKSIIEFDLVEPLVWNKRSGNLIGGHQRLKILKEMGHTEVEVSVVDLPDAKEKALNLALNKIQCDWDLPMLKNLLEELDTGAFDMEITGFDDKEIEDLMNQFHMPGEGLTDDDEIPEKVGTICKTGDLWQLGEHKLFCGDAFKKEDVDRLMNGEKADMVFTDPPYGINLDTDFSGMGGLLLGDKIPHLKHGKNYDKIKGDDKPFDPSFLLAIFKDCAEIILWGADYYAERIPLRNTGSFFVWDKTAVATFPDARFGKIFGSSFELCWSKTKHKRQIFPILWKAVFGFPGQDTPKRVHPTQKPVELCSWFIGRFSKEGNLIIDLFGGSGSTLIACEKLGRRCFMMEIDEHYCDIIIKRFQNFTGQKVVLINGH